MFGEEVGGVLDLTQSSLNHAFKFLSDSIFKSLKTGLTQLVEVGQISRELIRKRKIFCGAVKSAERNEKIIKKTVKNAKTHCRYLKPKQGRSRRFESILPASEQYVRILKQVCLTKFNRAS